MSAACMKQRCLSEDSPFSIALYPASVTAVVANDMSQPVIPEVEYNEADDNEEKLSIRIANWVRCTVERNWPSARCRSIEGRYRPERNSEQTEEEKRTPKRTQAEIDAAVRDAWAVEDAWKELPDLYKFCLQYTYLKGEKTREGHWKPWPQGKVWRKLAPYRSLRLRVRDYDEVLRLARFALANQLRRRRSALTGG